MQFGRIHPFFGKKDVPGTGLSAMRLEEKIEWFRVNVPKEPAAIAKKLHDAFGGEIWIDGVLCYKNEVEIENVFKLSPEEEAQVVVWSF